MSPVEAANKIGVGVSTIRGAIRQGLLKARKVPCSYNQWGYVYEITKQDLDAYRTTYAAKGTRFKTHLTKLRMSVLKETKAQAQDWIERVSKARRYQWFNKYKGTSR